MKKYLSKYEYRWALIFTLVSILWIAFEYEMGWHSVKIESHKWNTFFFFIPATICYFLFFLDKRSNRFKKRFKFKHAFYSGLGLTALIAVFSVPAQLLIHYFVSPDYLVNAQEYAVDSMQMTEPNAKKVFSISSFALFFPILYLLFGIFLSFIFGLLLRRVKYAGFKRKKRYKS